MLSLDLLELNSEIKVDTLLQTSHAALQYSLQAQRFLDGIFTSLTNDLRRRENMALPSNLSGNEPDAPDAVALLSAARSTSTHSIASNSKDPMRLLRTLAAAENKQRSEEAVTAAAAMAPVTAMTPRRPPAGTTPRRAGGLNTGTTPKRGYHEAPTPACRPAALI